MKVVKDNLLPNFPITINYILEAEYIVGTNEGSLKGEIVDTIPKHVRVDTISVPQKSM